MSTIVITRPDSAEMKSLKAYLAAQGHHVVSPPENRGDPGGKEPCT